MRCDKLLITILLSLLVTHHSLAEQTDITFVVAGKTSNHRQQADGSTAVLNYHFFAEIFLQKGGVVAPASLVTPKSDGVAVDFADSGYALEVHGGRYRDEAELEAAKLASMSDSEFAERRLAQAADIWKRTPRNSSGKGRCN